MALKAGTVGLNPKYVDRNGAPKGGNGSIDAYTKAETDDLLSAKADLTSLQANSKTFQFAYSGGKYGYKAGSDGDFHPFEEAGGPGWVKPATLIDTGLAYTDATVSKVEGGYYDDTTNKLVYVDIVLTTSDNVIGSSSGSLITGLPHNASFKTSLLMNLSAENNADIYLSNFTSIGLMCMVQTSGNKINKWNSGTFTANYYLHIWGIYPYTT